jgi:two-component system chemotaxis response regulator CheY
MTAPNASTDKTVYLVDDDSSTVGLYSNRLEQAGFRTASALVVEEAFAALPNLSTDLFILDLMLPKRGGFELLDAIRSDSRHKQTPVLLLSNAYLPDLAHRALKAGGNKALPRSECTSSELISISLELIGGKESASGSATARQRLDGRTAQRPLRRGKG